MKRLLLLLVLPIVSTGALAQSDKGNYQSSNKLINEALQRGRQPKKFYELQNTKGKSLKVEKIIEEVEAEGFIVGSYTTKNVNRFGDVASILNTLSFIPKAEYPEFIYEHVEDGNYSSLKSGDCWIFGKSKINKYENVKWSGSLSNGKLNGEGTAFYAASGNAWFFYVKGEFQNGIPLGDSNLYYYEFKSSSPDKVSFTNIANAKVGLIQDNMASFSLDGAKWGFLNNEGSVVIPAKYESVVKDFANGRAEVLSDGKEIIIDKEGNYIDQTARQKQIVAARIAKERQETLQREQERKRQELEERQQRIEREREAAEAEKRRKEWFRNCRPGDKIYYSEDYVHKEYFLSWETKRKTFTMRVVCFVEQNLDKGDRIQIRVGKVESSNSDYYKTPEIDGMKYVKGDVFWIRPLNDPRWQY